MLLSSADGTGLSSDIGHRDLDFDAFGVFDLLLIQ
jgi:hypothetical protein